MSQVKPFLTDAQWARIAPWLPTHRVSRKGGRPWADDRACLEGVLWVLKTGARWRDLPDGYPSAATCWRRLSAWQRADVWLDMWRAFLGELDQRGLLGWEECFIDGTFAPAKKGGAGVGNTRKGKGTKLMVLVERSGLPPGVCVEAASVAVSLAEPTLAQVHVPRWRGARAGPGRPKMKPTRLVADRGYDSRALWERLHRRGIDFIVPHLSTRTRRWQDGRKLRRYRHRWIIERTNAWLQNFRRLVVRYEHKLELYRTFVHIACALIVLRRL